MSEAVLMTANGHNGQLDLLETKIRIKRKGALGFVSHGYAGEREIQIDQISSINFKPAGMLANGYIQFTFLGGTQATTGITHTTRDENAIIFLKNQQPKFEQIKAAIDKKLVELKSK